MKALMLYQILLLQLNPSQTDFARPHNSAQGFHPGFFWVAFIVVAFISIRVYVAVEKDIKLTKKRKATQRRKTQNKNKD
ncbi:hypothetical protein DSECCO2_126890 [anaerobic digester metagenome]